MATLITKPLSYALCKYLAKKRLKEAELLHKGKEFNGAYYLSGYSIELSIKAYYCKGIKKRVFPPEPRVVNELYTHDLNQLLATTELKREFDNDKIKNQNLQKSWDVVKDWNEKSRYTKNQKSVSESMIESAKTIVTWIQTKW